MRLVLDTGVLGLLCHSSAEQSRPVAAWLSAILDPARAGGEEHRVILPEIADYELRRKLLQLSLRAGGLTTPSLERLDQLGTWLDYLPIRTETLRRAAALWARARHDGRPTAPNAALDGDMILVAQAEEAGGTVVTGNRKHLAPYVLVRDWTEIPPPP
ncbi:MAG: nucleic acid-binding protein [Planctomycetes bacterium]|nr:nucleic acid-binding protein [Planctomycetota bacterium]